MKISVDMTHGSIGDKLCRVALPIAATAVFQQMFNAADVAVVGQFAGKLSMAAVGSNASVVSLMVNLFTGISLGTNVVIANMIGAGNTKKIHDAVHTSILLALIGGLLVMLAGQLGAAPLLKFMSVPEDVFDLAVLYLRIYLLGLPIIFLYNFETAILRSQGNTQTPLICLMVSGVVNVILNLIFVIVFHLDVVGVALATVLANALSAGLLLRTLMQDPGDLRVNLKDLRIDPEIFRQIIRIGLPAGIQGMTFSVSNMCIQSGVNSLGSTVMAGSAAAYNVEIAAFYIFNGFCQAGTTFIGQNYGARDAKRCVRVSRICYAQGMAAGVILSVVLLIFGRQSLALFNSDPEVIDMGVVRMKAILTFEPLDVTMEMLPALMRGYGYAFMPTLVTILCVCGTRVIWTNFIFPMHPDFPWLMTVYPVSWIINCTVMVCLYLYMRKHVMKEFFAGI